MTGRRSTSLPRIAGRLLSALALVILVGALGQAPAGAHSQLLSTNPIDGATLESPPAEVVFTFDAPLLPDTPTVSINDADGQVVSSIHPVPDGDSVSIPWPQGTPPGDYQVAFRVVCADGQPLIGAITLTVTGSGSPSATIPSAASQSAEAAATPSAAPQSGAAQSAAALPAAADATPPAGGTPAKGLAVPVVVAVAVIAAAAVALIVILVSWRRGPRGPSATRPAH
jgi:methionine-rich copper-binding protein CopC